MSAQSPAAVAADALGLAYELTPIPRVRSLEEAAEALGISAAEIVKTLVVRLGEGDYRFVLVPGDRQISWPKLRAVLGVNRATMPTAEEALAVTGYERGTIAPLGSSTAWPVIADASVSGRINLGAGVHGIGLMVDAGELIEALRATSADVTER